MNIAKISNTNFKGAYVIAGGGVDVKKVEDAVESKLKENVKIDRLGYGYTSNDMMAYIMVTTGDDIKKYNDFLANKQEYFDSIDKNLPKERSEEEFETRHEHLAYRIKRAGATTIKAIRKYCNFDKFNILKAQDAIDAISRKQFNFKDGTIEE